MPKVSVIVPVYNVEKCVERCARSLFEQTLDDIEYIFVNDASTDASMQVLKNVIEFYPRRKERVVLIDQSINSGPSVTRNLGLQKASGQYVIFCDADDYLDWEAYESLYVKALMHDADIVACGIEVVSYNGVDSWHLLFGQDELQWTDLLNDFTKIEGGIYSSMCNKLVKREFLMKHGIFFNENTKMWEDLYTTIRARYFAKTMFVVDIPFYHYCMHQGSIIHSDIYSRVKSQIEVVKLIEGFFIDIGAGQEYSLMLAYLKFLSKEPLVGIDPRLWAAIFPESMTYLFQLKEYFYWKRIIIYVLMSLGSLGISILKVYNRVANFK